jgi:hypothetical protein
VLAHELQHAVEVAGAPGVTDATTLRQFFERVGQRVSDDGYCTPDAQKVQRIALYEAEASMSAKR